MGGAHSPGSGSLAVLIPFYNEEKTAGTLLARVLEQTCVAQVICVDDGSSDRTPEIVATFASGHPGRVELHRHPENRGKGAALRTAIPCATAPFSIIQDGDLEYDPGEYPRLLQPLAEDEADVVFGVRPAGHWGGGAGARLSRIANRLLTRTSNLLTGLALRDVETCYKTFRTPQLQSLPLRENRFAIEPELVAHVAARRWRTAEVPVSYDRRGRSQGKTIGWKDGVSALRCMVEMRLRKLT